MTAEGVVWSCTYPEVDAPGSVVCGGRSRGEIKKNHINPDNATYICTARHSVYGAPRAALLRSSVIRTRAPCEFTMFILLLFFVDVDRGPRRGIIIEWYCYHARLMIECDGGRPLVTNALYSTDAIKDMFTLFLYRLLRLHLVRIARFWNHQTGR